MDTKVQSKGRPIPYLKRERERRGVSARKLSAGSGVARATLTDLENGRRLAYGATIRKLAEALGCEPWDLTGIDPADMSEEERELLRHVLAGKKPYAVFVDEEDDET
jgi:transcriptional regulator with XRE-family HTH domain